MSITDLIYPTGEAVLRLKQSFTTNIFQAQDRNYGLNTFIDSVPSYAFDLIVVLILTVTVLVWLSRKWTEFKMLHPDYFWKMRYAEFGYLSMFKATHTMHDHVNLHMAKTTPDIAKREWEESIHEAVVVGDAVEGNFLPELMDFTTYSKKALLLSNLLPIFLLVYHDYYIIAIIWITLLWLFTKMGGIKDMFTFWKHDDEVMSINEEINRIELINIINANKTNIGRYSCDRKTEKQEDRERIQEED